KFVFEQIPEVSNSNLIELSEKSLAKKRFVKISLHERLYFFLKKLMYYDTKIRCLRSLTRSAANVERNNKSLKTELISELKKLAKDNFVDLTNEHAKDNFEVLPNYRERSRSEHRFCKLTNTIKDLNLYFHECKRIIDEAINKMIKYDRKNKAIQSSC